MQGTGALPRPVALDTFRHHGGTVRSRAPLVVETSPRQWDYAVSVPLALADADPALDLPIRVSTRVKVESGELGCLLVAPDWTTLVGLPSPAMGAGSHLVNLTWEQGDATARLVFRNHGSDGRPCVFTIESIQISQAPPDLLDYPLRSDEVLTLATGPDTVCLHNAAQARGGEGEFLSDPAEWGNSVSFPVGIPSPSEPDLQPMIVVDVHVLEGTVGISVLARDLQELVAPEVEASAGAEPARIELRLDAGGLRGYVMLRNTAAGGKPSRFRLLGATLQFTTRKVSPPSDFTDYPLRVDEVLTLPTGHDAVRLHHAARAIGDGEFLSDPAQWGNSVNFPVGIPSPPEPDLQPMIVVDVHVLEGAVGIAVLAEDLQEFLAPEVEAGAAREPARIELRLDTGGRRGLVMLRNAADRGEPSRFRLLGATLQFAERKAPFDPFDYSLGIGEVASLIPGRGALRLHNAAKAIGEEGEFLSDPVPWGYSVSLPVAILPPPEPDLQPMIVVHLHVLEGAVGVAVLADDLQRFITLEVAASASTEPARIELRLDTGGVLAHVIVRNAADREEPSRFKLLGATLQFTARNTSLLVSTPLPEIGGVVHGTPAFEGVFDVLVSLTSRRWVAEQCDRGYLRDRWARPDRLRELPPFNALPPHHAPYYGLLSVFRVGVSAQGVTGDLARHYVSPEKVMHTTEVGDEVVVCFDEGLAVVPRAQDSPWVDVIPERAARITDPWFGGLHTVMAEDDRTCLVSSSGADAILWVDVPRRQVVRRWRLPASRYGTNYALDETTWLSEHYIPNDLQLGHLNCAAPDGRGGVYFSVLGQGDICHLDASGDVEVLASGYVGCHGVRYDRDADLLYFSDSCGGRLMRVEDRDRAEVLFDAGSRWLHDAVHLGGGLFLLTLGDQNTLVLADTRAGRRLAEWDFSASGGTVQFLSVG